MTWTALIGIDWGTSNLRGFLYSTDGRVLETRARDAGLKKVASGSWQATFETQFGDWLQTGTDVPVLLCGMVGSRQGWSEAPYVECPAGVAALAERLHTIPATRCRIVPGVCTFDRDGIPDVLRGEETQLAGLDQSASPVVCLPGTHCKWVKLGSEGIVTFRTMMTGELFDVLAHHSLLAQMTTAGEFNRTAFLRGFECGFHSRALLHDLFTVRALRLFDRLEAVAVSDYLSGILIGHELAEAGDLLAGNSRVTVIGSPALAERYAVALQQIGRVVDFVDGETASARGLWRIAVQAGMVKSA